MFFAQRLPKAVQAGLAPSFGDEQHARAVEIVDDGEVAMALTKALLVDAQMGDRLGAAARQAALHGAFEDAVNLVPAQCEQLGDALLAGFFQPRDRESFKQRRVPIQLITLASSEQRALESIPFLEPDKTSVWHQGFSTDSLHWIDWGDGADNPVMGESGSG